MKNSTLKDILSSIKDSSPKTQPYDTMAEVVRVDGDTVWVHIPGGVDETPVRKTINANIGDKIQLRVSGGNAWITGNSTAPPTDDTTARAAKATAEAAQTEANEASDNAYFAQRRATSALKIAGDTAQHFWMTEEGTDTGAHITEATQDEFLADPENGGGNLLARSNGIAVRDGLAELATFSRDGVSINSYDQFGVESEIAFLGYGATSGSWTGEAPYYTLGVRTPNSNIGPVSFVEGYNNTASGEASHAGGEVSEASGNVAFAQGYGALAAHNMQTAIGMYNDNQSANAFEIGNGGPGLRSNALTVDWSGNVDAAGSYTIGGDPLFVKESYSASYSVSGGGDVSLTNNDFNVTIPAGYTPIAITRISSGDAAVLVRSFNPATQGTSSIVNLRNVSGSALSSKTCNITILFAKEEMF